MDVEELDALGSETDGSSEEDEDYVPKENQPRRLIKKKKRRRRRKKKQILPDLDTLSLPKPRAVLEEGYELCDGALVASIVDDSVDCTNMDAVTPREGATVTIKVASKPTRANPIEPCMEEYKKIYSKQLPGMTIYWDAYQCLLRLDGENPEQVVGGATFRLLELLTMCGKSVLILDVLALAVSREVMCKGLGSMLVDSLKTVAAREAAARGCRPLLLTQADVSCVGFWAKMGLQRAMDANALIRSLRRRIDLVWFTGATPMAMLM